MRIRTVVVIVVVVVHDDDDDDDAHSRRQDKKGRTRTGFVPGKDGWLRRWNVVVSIYNHRWDSV